MTGFDLSAVEDKVYEKKFIDPGIHTNVMITKVEGFTPEGKSPYVQFDFSKDGLTASTKVFLSENAMKWSLPKIKHFLTKFYTEEQANAVGGANAIEFGTNLNNALANKVIPYMKFKGTEIEGKDGKKNWWKADLGWAPFASTENTLTWDKNDPKDMEALAPASNMDVIGDDSTTDTGLPF